MERVASGFVGMGPMEVACSSVLIGSNIFPSMAGTGVVRRLFGLGGSLGGSSASSG